MLLIVDTLYKESHIFTLSIHSFYQVTLVVLNFSYTMKLLINIVFSLQVLKENIFSSVIWEVEPSQLVSDGY